LAIFILSCLSCGVLERWLECQAIKIGQVLAGAGGGYPFRAGRKGGKK